MGLSFLKRKKKNKCGCPADALLLNDDPLHHDDVGTKNQDEDATVSRFAVLQPAATASCDGLSRQASRDALSSSQQSGQSPSGKRGRGGDGSRDGSGSTACNTTATTAANTTTGMNTTGGGSDGTADGDGCATLATPSPARSFKMPSFNIRSSNLDASQDDTPLISNQMSSLSLSLERDANRFMEESCEGYGTDTGTDYDQMLGREEEFLPRSKLLSRSAGPAGLHAAFGGGPGLPTGKEKKKRRTVKKMKIPKLDKRGTNRSGQQAGSRGGGPESHGPATSSKGGKIANKVGGGLRRGFLQPSKKDTAPVATMPPSPPPRENSPRAVGDLEHHRRRRRFGGVGNVGNIMLDLEYDDTKSIAGGGAELELTLGDGGRGITAADTARDGGGEDDGDDDDALGVAYDRMSSREDEFDAMETSGAMTTDVVAGNGNIGYDELDLTNGSVARKRTSSVTRGTTRRVEEEADGGVGGGDALSLASYLESLGDVIDDLLVGNEAGTAAEARRRQRSAAAAARRDDSRGREDSRGPFVGGGAGVDPDDPDDGGAAVGAGAAVVGAGAADGGRDPRIAADGGPRIPSGVGADGRVRSAAASPADSKFLSRLRRIGGAGRSAGDGGRVDDGGRDDEGNDDGGGDDDGGGGGRARPVHRENSAVANNPNPVPEFINGDDCASMPSMLTEPPELRSAEDERERRRRRKEKRRKEVGRRTTTTAGRNGGGRRRGGGIGGGGATPPDSILRPTSFSFDARDRACGGPTDALVGGGCRPVSPGSSPATTTASATEGTSVFGGGREDAAGDDGASYGDDDRSGSRFGNGGTLGHDTATGGFTTAASTAVSSASRAGGIERLLGALTCGLEDTTLGDVVRCGLPVCGGTRGGGSAGSGGDVRREAEGEREFALEFQSDIIKNGIKLIYHESPSSSADRDPSSAAEDDPDWVQSTVKLFLRPGNCLDADNRHALKQPTLAWAVLPVVSRMQVAGSFDSSEEEMWTRLGLLDVHTILVDEGTVGERTESTDFGEGAGDDSGTRSSVTGFFSVTATDGAVHVFEAPSARRRDYVVGGLRAAIARMTYHMVAGNADVMGEMFSEDAGALTGELPSLATPWKALRRVTHTFLDQL